VRVPPYFEALVAAHARGAGADHVHLGHWDDPPPLDAPTRPGEFAAAQERLAALMIDMADLADGQRVLDVGCGFGGTARMAQGRAAIALTGVNVDPRQLAVCRALGPGRWIAADACRLPFADARFDRVVCVEAAFHFASRSAFLAEAARVLRPGGRLVLSDILLRRPTAGPLPHPEIERALCAGYGPWPEPWTSRADLDAAATAAGLALVEARDATANTLPSYRVTAPRRPGGRWDAGSLLRWLHASGHAAYPCLAYERAA
jgi:MPBQ/MSBQ methyltransferase